MAILDDLKRELADQFGRELQEASNSVDIINRYCGHSDTSTIIQYKDTAPDPVDLFWSFYRPRFYYRNDNDTTEEFSELVNKIVLKFLESLYQTHRVPYDPDGDDSDIQDFRSSPSGTLADVLHEASEIPEEITKLLRFLHIAAARAFRIQQNQGGNLSEEVLTCLREVERAVNRLKLAGLVDPTGIVDLIVPDEFGELRAEFFSAQLVSAKAFAELSHFSRGQGRYAEGLSYLAEAVNMSSYAVEFYMGDGQAASEDMREMYSRLDREWRKGLDNISPQEITSMFTSLKRSGQTDSWMRVVWDCRLLLRSDFTWGVNEPESVISEEGEDLSWREFWHRALGWAEAQLSPNEYRKMQKADMKSASKQRLTNYFFHQYWPALPERARERLVTADVIWNSPEKLAWESTLSDLRIATEEMCYKFIWEPLSRSSGGKDILEFLSLKHTVDIDGRRPEIREYIQVCGMSYLKNFLKRRNISEKDVKFVTHDLATAMEQLREARNFGEHQSRGTLPREKIRPLVRRFFGMGIRGILPELARIGQKIRKG